MTLLCVAVDTNQIGSVGRMTLLCVAGSDIFEKDTALHYVHC